jgi:hypothetical protein
MATMSSDRRSVSQLPGGGDDDVMGVGGKPTRSSRDLASSEASPFKGLKARADVLRMQRFARTPARWTVLIVSLFVVIASMSPASADDFTPVDIDNAAFSLVDPDRSVVYTTDWSRAVVHVFGFDGSMVADIAVNTRGETMELDDGTLYVALPDDDSIAVIDPDSLSVTEYLEFEGLAPRGFTIAGDRVWFTPANSSAWWYSAPLDDPSDLTSYEWEPGQYPFMPSFASSGSDPDLLFAYAWYFDTMQVFTYDVATDPITLVSLHDAGSVAIGRLIGAPDPGRYLYSHGGDAGAGVAEVRVSDGQLMHAYPLDGEITPSALALTTDGSHVAVARATDPTTIDVFARLGTTPVRSFPLGSSCMGTHVTEQGLGFDATEDRLVAVTTHNGHMLRTYDDPTVTGGSAVIDVEPPADAAPGDVVEIVGDLDLGSSAEAGRTIEIWEGIGTEAHVADTVTSGAGGAFSFTREVDLAHSCFTAFFRGTPTESSISAVVVVPVERIETVVTIDEPSDTKIAPGDAVTIEGTVTDAAGEDQSGRPLLLLRTRETAPFTTTEIGFDAGTDGAYSIVDVAPDEGRFSYAVAAPATERYTHGFARQVADITVAKLDPKIWLQPSKRTIDFGRTVGVEVGVPIDATNQTVRVYESKVGGARRLLHDGPVGSDGTISFTRAPRVNTRYSVEYDGDARYRESTVKIDVGVRAIVATRLLRAAGASGRYKLYRASQPVFILAAVAPDHTGKRVTIDLELSKGGRWKSLASDDFRLRKGSAVVVFIPGGALRSGMQLRTRSIFDDADHALGRSRYAYFRVISGRILGSVERTPSDLLRPGTVSGSPTSR